MPENPAKKTRPLIFISLWSLTTVVVAAVTVLGGKIAPSPWKQSTVRGTRCVDSAKRGWYFPHGPHRCLNALDATRLHHPRPSPHPDTTHYAFQVPLGDDSDDFSYSRWQWSLYGVLHLSLLHNTGYWSGKSSAVTVVARLGHGSPGSPYNTTLLAQGYQNPPVYCSNVQHHTLRGRRFDCASAVVMMLHSLHHPTYLLNILLPIRRAGNARRTNINIGRVKAVYVTFFSVSARYMQVLVGLQCLFFPVVGTLLWHFRQGVKRLPRNPTHLECCLALLAVSLTLRNCPVEVVALVVDCPWLVVINDLRRNFFYAAFMIYFVYLTDRHAKGVWCERSTQTLNLSLVCGVTAVAAVEVTAHVGSLLHPLAPSHPPIHLALSLLMLVMVAAFLVALTLRTCAALETVCVRRAGERRESGCQAGMVLVLTWLTSFITAAEFVLNRVQEGVWMWGGLLGEVEVENTGGFLLGVYSLWNTFTATLLVLHTPTARPPPPPPPACSDTNRVVGVPLQCRHSPSFLDLTVTTL